MCQQPICKCGFDSCLNGGFFSASTCSCICPTQYTGIRCDNLIAATTLKATSTTTTTKSACAMQLTCLNGGKLNAVTCNCECN